MIINSEVMKYAATFDPIPSGWWSPKILLIGRHRILTLGLHISGKGLEVKGISVHAKSSSVCACMLVCLINCHCQIRKTTIWCKCNLNIKLHNFSLCHTKAASRRLAYSPVLSNQFYTNSGCWVHFGVNSESMGSCQVTKCGLRWKAIKAIMTATLAIGWCIIGFRREWASTPKEWRGKKQISVKWKQKKARKVRQCNLRQGENS